MAAASPARPGLGVGAAFGDDALAYFTARLDPESTRAALGSDIHHAKRNVTYGEGATHGHSHHCALLTVVGTGITLPPGC